MIGTSLGRSRTVALTAIVLACGAVLAHGEAFTDPSELIGVWQRYGQGQPGVWLAFEFAEGNRVVLVEAEGEILPGFYELRPDGLIEISAGDRVWLLDVHDRVEIYAVMTFRQGQRWRFAREVFVNGVFEKLVP